MSRAMQRVDESIVTAGSSTAATLDRIELALRIFDVDVRRLAAALKLSVTDRGLLRTVVHECVVAVVAEPQRQVVSIVGEIQAEVLEAVRAAALGRSIERLRVSSDVQSASGESHRAPVELGLTASELVGANEVIVPPPPTGQRVAPAPAATAGTLLLHFPDGRVVPLSAAVVLGRNPVRPAGFAAAALLVRLDHDEVSKTHLVMTVAEGAVLINDCNSTNGTFADVGSGWVRIPPGPQFSAIPPFRLQVGPTIIAVSGSRSGK